MNIYPRSFQDALDYEQTDQWRASNEENIACKNFIEQTIRENFDGMHLSADSAKKVVDEFGYKRTAFVLANSVQMKSSDGRFSRENKNFASSHSFADRKEHRALFAVDSHPAVLDGFINQYQRLYSELGLLTSKHCLSKPEHQNYEGQVVVVNPSYFAEGYLKVENQLWLATGGFGCDPNSSGNAVYATCIADGEKARWERYQILGVVDEKHLPQWASEKLITFGLKDKQIEENELLNMLKSKFSEIENACFEQISSLRNLGIVDDINIAIAIIEKEYLIDEDAYSSEDLARKYVEVNFPDLDPLITENIYYEWLATDLESEEPEFMSKTYDVNFADDPSPIYDGLNTQELFNKYQEAPTTQILTM
ncbi:MAG: DUF3849 domain-containing protein [Clostridia bacterium]